MHEAACTHPYNCRCGACECICCGCVCFNERPCVCVCVCEAERLQCFSLKPWNASYRDSCSLDCHSRVTLSLRGPKDKWGGAPRYAASSDKRGGKRIHWWLLQTSMKRQLRCLIQQVLLKGFSREGDDWRARAVRLRRMSNRVKTEVLFFVFFWAFTLF